MTHFLLNANSILTTLCEGKVNVRKKNQKNKSLQYNFKRGQETKTHVNNERNTNTVYDHVILVLLDNISLASISGK